MTNNQEINNKYQRWLEKAIEDQDIVKELRSISNDDLAITERFYKDLEFGTGGLRGVLGAGTNRLNIYTVRKVSQGISDYLTSNFKEPSIAIGYDSRINSTLFAIEAARVYSANGIKVYLFKSVTPTPILSYAIRHLKTTSGIVITASHNPSEYNGYKVYNSDGFQLTDDLAATMTRYISKIDIFNDITISEFKDSISKGLIRYISDDLYEDYYKEVLDLSITKDFSPKKIKITYTPLNGAGFIPVTTILKRAGFNNLQYVTEQIKPDGHFTTCLSPNPEGEEAWEYALRYAKENDSDVIIATDPDSDRVGVQVKHNGEYVHLTGNAVGSLLFDFICQKKALPKHPVVIKTIVTTNMIERMAKEYGVEVINLLTGFKYIGEQMTILEKNNRKEDFLLGLEESIGYLSGFHARDKDAINATLIILEMCEYYLEKGQTLVDRMEEISSKIGYFISKQHNYVFKGIKGRDTITKVMNDLRHLDGSTLLGTKVRTSDYLKRTTIDFDGSTSSLTLPKANVLKYDFLDGSSVILRPSGTEPKLKLYCLFTSTSKEAAEMLEESYSSIIDKFISEHTL